MANLRRYTVPVLNSELDQLLQGRFPSILVEAEVGQMQIPQSGHCYLVLRDRGGPRDADCSLQAVVWRDDWTRLRHRPKMGERVVCRGRLALYTPRGSVQLYVNDIAPVGQGDLAKEIEARKARLDAEGLLDPRRKRALPQFPRVIGLATSATGAALQDFLKVSRQRFPATQILLAPCIVQGMEAPGSVIRAIELLIEDGRSSVIVVTRGGGSKEDLLPFHDEQLARFVAHSPIPIVSAVGHQIDTTIIDLVADVVAPTPSAAALTVLPDVRELRQRIDELTMILKRHAGREINYLRERVDSLQRRLRHPHTLIRDGRLRWRELSGRLRYAFEMNEVESKRRFERLTARLRQAAPTWEERRCRVELLENRLKAAVQQQCYAYRGRWERSENRLSALSPKSVLKRGFAMVEYQDKFVRSASEIPDKAFLKITVEHGIFFAQKTDVHYKK